MATVGDIAVNVGANVADLKMGMRSASGSVDSFSKKASRSLGKYGKKLRAVTSQTVKLGAVAGAAGAAMIAGIVAKQAPVIDSLAKTADALGVTTERLQALNLLAELNGVSSEAMSKGLRRMETNLGMAARSGGAAADALEDIGININDILKLRPDQQITQLSKALAGIDNQAIRASIATDIFGREGIAMLKVLNQIEKDGIEPTVEQLKSFGAAISRVDAAKVEAANDAFLKAQTVIQGAATSLTVELSPFIQEVADRFTAAAVESKGFGDEIQSGIIKGIKVAGKLGDFMQGLKVVFKGVELIAVGFGAAVVSAFQVAIEAGVLLADSFIRVSNDIVAGLNLIPGVDIMGTGLLTNSPFLGELREFADSSRDHVGVIRNELGLLAETPLPSTAIEEFLTSVQQKSLEVAETVAKSAEEMQERTVGTFTIDPTLLEEEAAILQAHFDNLNMIADKGFSGMEGIFRRTWGVAGAETANAMKSVLATMSTGSRKAFEVTKAWGIADALVSTFQGIAAGVKLGWPMAIPAVAWAAANGFAQVSAIKNQKFGGGGGGGSSSSSAAAAGPAPTAQQAPSQTLRVDALDPGQLITGGTFNSVIDQISDFTADGGKLVMGS